MKKVMTVIISAALILSISENVYSAVLDYTLGNKYEAVSVNDFYDSDRLGEIKGFTSADGTNFEIGFNKGAEYVYNTSPGSWLLYKNVDIDFGGVNRFLFSVGKEGAYKGYMRIYTVDTYDVEVKSDGTCSNGRLIGEKYITEIDNTGSWTIPKENYIEITDSNISGKNNLLITFSDYGLGNFYDFQFEKRAVRKSSVHNMLSFTCSEIEVKYETLNTSEVFISTCGQQEYILLEPGDKSAVVKLDKPILPGVNDTKIYLNGNAQITELIYRKMPEKVCQSVKQTGEDNYPVTSYSDYEELMKTAVILSSDSPVYICGNAKRYIDYNNPSKKPYIGNNRIYVPSEAFSLMIGGYHESDNEYMFIRKDGIELKLKDKKLTKRIYGGAFEETENDILFKNGEFLIPAAKYLKLFKGDVYEKDGIIISDNDVKLDKLTDNKMINYISDIFKNMSEVKNGRKIYVSKDIGASDGNEGSREKPYLTISKACEIAEAGDEVIIGGGTYREILKPKNNGTAASPIVFKAAEGEEVVLSALEELNDYTLNNNLRIYRTTGLLEKGRNQIFLNGEALSEAKYPNNAESENSALFKELGLSPLWPVTGRIKVNGSTAECENDEFVNNYWMGGTLVSFHGNAWNLATAKITSSNGSILNLGEKTKYWWSDGNYTENDYGYITGTRRAIDIPGEWYADSSAGRIYIYPYSENDRYEVKKRMLCADLSDKEYIHICGINTIGGSIKMADSNMCVINGGEHKYISHYTYSNDQHYGFIKDGNVFDLNGAPRNGEMGILLGGKDNAIINTKIRYSAAAGIYATGKYGLIYNNTIEETGYMGGYDGGIFIVPDAAGGNITDQRGGHTVYYNTVDKAGRGVLEISAIEETWFSRYGLSPFIACDIAYNVFAHGSLIARDTGNIYIHGVVLGDDELKTRIHNNIIYDSCCLDSLNRGAYFDNYTQMAQFYENVLFYTDYVGNIPDSKLVYIQPSSTFPDSFATVDSWNNAAYDRITDSLKEYQYPLGMPFGCGAQHESLNRDSGKNSIFYTDNKISYDVEFADDSNAVEIYYTMNCYDDKTVIKVTAGDREEVVTLVSGARKKNALNSIKVPANTNSDKITVQIEIIKQGGADICGIMPTVLTGKYDGMKYYGGDFTECTGSAKSKVSPDGNSLLLYETRGKQRLRYRNVSIPESSNILITAYSSDNQYSGGKVRMYDKEENLLCEWIINKLSWNDYTPQVIPLTKTFDKYFGDIYIEFDGNNNNTCNLWWFKFSESQENTELSEIRRDRNSVRGTAEGGFSDMFAAVYDKTGKLCSVRHYGNNDGRVAFEVYTENQSSDYTIKIISLSDKEKLIPYGKAITYKAGIVDDYNKLKKGDF